MMWVLGRLPTCWSGFYDALQLYAHFISGWQTPSILTTPTKIVRWLYAAILGVPTCPTLNQLESAWIWICCGDSTLKKSKHICSYNGSQGSPWLSLAVDTAHSPQTRSLISLRRPHLFGNLGLRSRFKMSEGKLWRTRCTTNQASRGLHIIQHANMRELWEMHEDYVKIAWQAYLYTL